VNGARRGGDARRPRAIVAREEQYRRGMVGPIAAPRPPSPIIGQARQKLPKAINSSPSSPLTRNNIVGGWWARPNPPDRPPQLSATPSKKLPTAINPSPALLTHEEQHRQWMVGPIASPRPPSPIIASPLEKLRPTSLNPPTPTTATRSPPATSAPHPPPETKRPPRPRASARPQTRTHETPPRAIQSR